MCNHSVSVDQDQLFFLRNKNLRSIFSITMIRAKQDADAMLECHLKFFGG